MTLQFAEGSFTKITTDATQQITGVGFQPKALILYAGAPSENAFLGSPTFFLGFGTTSSDRSIRSYIEDFTDPTEVQRHWDVDSVWNNFGGGGGGSHAEADINSFDSDGFTLSWTDNNDVSSIIYYIAIGGDDVTNTSVGHFTVSNSTGNDAVTGVGFEPDLVLLFSVNTTQDVDQAVTRVNQMIGCFNDSGEQGVSDIWANDNVSPSDCTRYQRTDRCVSLVESTTGNTFTHEASFSSMDSDGFTLNYSAATASAKRVAYLAIRGLKTKIASFNSPTSGATPVSQSISTVGFQPRGLILMTVGKTAGTSVVDHARISFGAGDDNGNRGLLWGGARDNVTNVFTAAMQESDNIVRVGTEASSASSSTTQALADLTSFGASGFTLSWGVRDTGNAYQILYIALGNTSTLFERSVNETVSVAATLAVQKNLSRSVAVNLFINDTVAKKLTAFRTITIESLTVIDNVARLKNVSRSIVESLTVSDVSVTRFLDAIRSASESLTINAVVERQFSVGRSLVESLSIIESLSAARQFLGNVSESLTVADTDVARFYRAIRTIPVSLTIADAIDSAFVVGRDLIESFSINAAAARVASTSRELAESLTVATDAVATRLTFLSRSVFESLAVTEDGFVEICKTAGQLKEIIIHKLGRFFSVLPQRNIRAYTFDSDIIRQKNKETLG